MPSESAPELQVIKWGWLARVRPIPAEVACETITDICGAHTTGEALCWMLYTHRCIQLSPQQIIM